MRLIPGGSIFRFFFLSLVVFGSKICMEQRAPYPKQRLLLDTCLKFCRKNAPTIQIKVQGETGRMGLHPAPGSSLGFEQDVERASNKILNWG